MTLGNRRDPHQESNPAYFDFRAVDPKDPDFKSIFEYMVDNHPDPYRGKKFLCDDARLSLDSLRKYVAGTYGPGFGLVDTFMRRTGCYRLLYWLARRHGFILVEEPDIRWDQRKRLKTDNELDRVWVELRALLHDIDYQPGRKLSNYSARSRDKALALVQTLQEQLVGLDLALRNVNPQIDLFSTREDDR